MTPPSKIDPYDLVKSKCDIFTKEDACNFALIGVIPFEYKLLSPRTYDMAQHLGATIIKKGDIMNRRVDCIKIVARSVKNMVCTLKANTLIITPADRDDIILAVCMAATNGVPLAGLALSGGYEPDSHVLQLCSKAFKTGLPLLALEMDSYVTAATASNIDKHIAIDDIERIKKVMNYSAERLRISECIMKRCTLQRQPRMSPAAFMYLLETLAMERTKRIVLPEGDDPRIIKAAVICHERNIARCTILGDPSEVLQLAEAQDLTLPDDLEILNPDMDMRLKYVDAMVELRKHKGLSRPMALAQLEDVSVLGTMMLAVGDVDGLVSGACHSTANTVRPALQLIKTRADAKLISSIFFMLLPNQVCIYGDCAINPDPNADELADIALQSAASAEAFGIEPRVAMLSYSTGNSGKGSDVDKVREATRIAQERRPDLLIDGPLQFDAACSADVAVKKAPNSKVAGNATVLVFPDLNTGNTTYKAVQRTAQVVAVGPMLQGLRRPVNDLSRGCLVEDIVYTIALTAIQATKAEEVIKTPVPTRQRKEFVIPHDSELESILAVPSIHTPKTN
jgi:phosphate acetyltransferase